MKNLLLIALFFHLLHLQAKAQVDFYDVNTIQKIEIYFSQPDWDYQLDTAKEGSESYITADWVKVNNVQFNNAGVKYKGNSSFDSTKIKNPIHIELDNSTPQSYQGFTDIKLSNGYSDPSVIREVLAYDVLKNYMDCPRSNFATVYINGAYIGLYSNDESIDKKFCSRNFNSSSGTFFKCNPVVTPGPTTKSNLRYIPGVDSTGYFNFYELKSDYGWDELVRLCDTVTNYSTSIDLILDVDRIVWMLAFNSVLVNLDSYTGVFCQNYYLYRDKTGRFNPVIWDLNMAFGGFPFVGSGGTSMGSLTITNMVQLSPTFHDVDPFWPLINAVMGNPTWKKQYIAHARTIISENFSNGGYLNTATQLQTLVDSSVQADTNALFNYAQFQNGITTDYMVGSYMVPGLGNLMDARAAYLQSLPDFQTVPPSISTVSSSNSSPELNDTVTITALVTNSVSVYLGYRNSTSAKFIRSSMFDDGLHNDGMANDSIFGIQIPIGSLFAQYYIYAENNDAAQFSPERAEHEFYTLQTNWTYPFAGQIVIN
ncbi:MAG: CotH kinase family protein [Bacteroidetes bacterium]|nr:CotH kinase family protein [Bacteroidota bacterium]